MISPLVYPSNNILQKSLVLITLATSVFAQRTWELYEGKECSANTARACTIRGHNPGIEDYDFSHGEICDDSTARFRAPVTLDGATEACTIAAVVSTGECEINGKAGFGAVVSARNEKSTPLGEEDSVFGQYTFGVGCAQGAWVSGEVRIAY